MLAPEPSHSRTSSRLLGQNREFRTLRVYLHMYLSRSAFRHRMRIDTEEPEGEQLSELEQDPLSEAEDELDPTDIEATPTPDPKGIRPEVVLQHPTPMKPIAIPETKEEREQREVHTFIDTMFSIYHFHKPDESRFEATL